MVGPLKIHSRSGFFGRRFEPPRKLLITGVLQRIAKRTDRIPKQRKKPGYGLARLNSITATMNAALELKKEIL